MARRHANQYSDSSRGLKKFFLSAFVVLSFIAYLLHERSTNGTTASAGNTSASSGVVPLVAAPPASMIYRNGTFTGPESNAYYGLVQVQVVIQNGKIADVQFLDYPHDRRTSQMINTQVMPWLKQEALQAQGANVNIISGATLTSEAFANSLQAALGSASN